MSTLEDERAEAVELCRKLRAALNDCAANMTAAFSCCYEPAAPDRLPPPRREFASALAWATNPGLDLPRWMRERNREVRREDAMTVVVTVEEIVDLLESGDDSEEGPTRRWCDEMGEHITALVAERWAARERALNTEHAEQQRIVAEECDRQTAERTAAAVEAAVANERARWIEHEDQAVEEARREEREACAQVAEAWGDDACECAECVDDQHNGAHIGLDIGQLIRARTSASEGVQDPGVDDLCGSSTCKHARSLHHMSQCNGKVVVPCACNGFCGDAAVCRGRR